MGARSSQPRSPNLNKTDGHLLEYFRNTFVEGGAGTNAPTPVSITQASGGVISDYTDPGPNIIYRSHIFANTDTFTVTESVASVTTADFLLVAGGGGGGTNIN